MLFKQINEKEFYEVAPKMFLILSSNMRIIKPQGTLSDDNFSDWLKYQKQHFSEKVFIIFKDKNDVIGYFQYSIADDNLLIEEIEIAPKYQVQFGVLRGLFRFMRHRIPDNIIRVSAYISKSNPRSYKLAEKLGLSIVKENSAGTSFLYEGEIQPILKRYME